MLASGELSVNSHLKRIGHYPSNHKQNCTVVQAMEANGAKCCTKYEVPI